MSRSARSRSPIQNEPTTSEEMSRSARSRSPIQNVPTTSEDSDMASGRSRSPCLKKITELHPDKSVGENWPVEGKILIPKSKAIKWGYQVSKNGLEYFNVVLEDESGKIEMIAFGSKFSEAYGERLKRTKKVRINKADLEEKDEDFKYILGHDYQIILNEKTKLDIVEAKEMSRSARSRVPKQNDATPREESRRNGDREGSNLKKENRTQTNDREGSNLKKENRTQTNEREGSNIKKETITQTMEAKLEQNDEITFESERMFEDGKNKKNLDGGASLITKVPAIKAQQSDKHKFKKTSNDNLSQTNVQKIGEMMESVGAVLGTSKNTTLGTCFRFGNKFVLTAYHVIKDIKAKDPSSGFNVTFCEYLQNYLSEKVYNAKFFDGNDDMDVALLEIVDEDELPVPIPISEEKYFGKVALMGYGNTENPASKQFEPPCEVIIKTSDTVKKAKKYVKTFLKKCELPSSEGYYGLEKGHVMLISCWQQQGASGAPLIDIKNSDSLGVVGILTHGLPKVYWERFEKTPHRYPKKYLFEVGTKINSVVSWLKKEHPQLYSNTADPDQTAMEISD